MTRFTAPVDSKWLDPSPVAPIHLMGHLLTRPPRGVLNDKDRGLILYYQYYPFAAKEAGGDGNNGYLYGWNELGWEDDWPYVKEAGSDANTGSMYNGNELGSEQDLSCVKEAGSDGDAAHMAGGNGQGLEDDWANVKVT